MNNTSVSYHYDVRAIAYRRLRIASPSIAALHWCIATESSCHSIAALAPTIPDVFMHDTRNFDVETEALDVIWENKSEFENKAMALMNNANAFADLAATGDRGQTLGAFRALGGSCGDCHDTFRVDND